MNFNCANKYFWALLTVAALILPVNGQAAVTDISNAPLVAAATTNVKPNLMFVLDDSGSMDWDYLPDWVNDSTYCKGSACVFGDPPYLASDFNYVTYNPAITYTPALNADGTSKPSMTSANTSGWTSVKNDAYNIQSTTSKNLIASYPDTSWCTASGCGGTCLRNDNYILPGSIGGTSYSNRCTTTATGTGQTATGSFSSPSVSASRSLGPYYYAIIAGEYCTAPDLRTCTTASAPTGIYTFPAKVRWCSNAALTTCQAINTGTYNKIRYPGVAIAASGGTSATATITISGSGSTSISSITVNGQEILSAATSASTTTSTVASRIEANIDACTAAITGNCQVAGFSASRSSSTLTITAPAAMGSITFTPVVTMAGAAPPTATITIAAPGGATSTSIAQVSVNGTNLLSGPTAGSSSSSTVAVNLRNKINTTSGLASGAITCPVPNTVWCATRSGSMVTITAPVALGGITFLPVVTIASGNLTATPTAFVVPGVMFATTSAFSGGVNPTSAYYVPGSFKRIDIVPGTTSYPAPGDTVKAATRTDCAGTTCTYAEEMTNFANWWTYYHTRMQMMKSATSNAFATVGSNYRVGFFTINNNTSGDLAIADFDAAQKAAWYDKLTAANPDYSTPLRASLSKAGRIFAHKESGWADPMQYSCQQNFTILSTDGYWNGTGGSKLAGTGSAMDDQDGTASGAVRPQLDGNNTSNTLADAAYYYYTTDLRNSSLSNCSGALGNDVCADNVPISSKDNNTKQHMTTFTLGLGIDGYMRFSPTYETESSGDFFDVRNGTAANPSGGICSWQSSGTCNWPTPSDNSQSNIDDLWHAAVNGHGTYFSAKSPAELSTGLATALAGVSARNGAAAAATTSNPNVTSGDNFVFSSTFTTADWTGELVRQQLDINTGQVLAAIDWSAQTLLDAKTSASSDTRTIYTNSGGNLVPFIYANVPSAYFNANSLSQYPTLSAANKTLASGQNLVDYLRGQRQYEGILYRQRQHVLGDIVSAEAVYVKTPMLNFSDAGYGAYKTANATRQGVVYVAANDGMLHAFNADTGQEMWAYVPALVLSNLYKLADNNYPTQHQYYVDGTPTVSDAYIGGAWKTLLVGGLNAGGRGYYALDITNPSAPVPLWEVTNTNMGYTFGNPVITKKIDHTWVVLVTSGYNNISTGDGKGHLFVLNAATGAIITDINTGAGDTTTPSGLARISAWADNGSVDNTALRAYGGDLLGNLWRFDINNNLGSTGYDAQLLANFSTGTVQPITAKPELGECNTKPVIMVGTGRYLGASDLTDLTQQTFYAVKDELISGGYGNFRSDAAVVTQTVSTSGATRTTSNNPVDFTTKHGWRLDLPTSGERANTDPTMALGTLVFTTNIPNASACSVGGDSWIYFLDFCKGTYVTTSSGNVAAQSLGNELATRPVVLSLPNNSIVSLTRTSGGRNVTTNIPTDDNPGPTRRVSWRELISDQ